MPEANLDSTPVPDRNPLPILPMRSACAALTAALRPPLDGFVIVLAPSAIADINIMASEVEALVNEPSLATCRWVWLLDAEDPWPTLLERVGDRGLRCECIPDPGQQKKDFAAMTSAAPTMIGRAGPRGITPPRRVTDPPPMPPEERAAALRAAGVNPEYCDKAPELQRLILSAAVAMKNEERTEAVRQQQAACDLALSLELFDVAVVCRVALSSYLMASGFRDEALVTVKSAAELARERGLPLQEAQAYLGIGVLLALSTRYWESSEAYSTSARCAEAANVPMLAIEAWRMAGQVALQAPDREKACQSFREAIRVAKVSEPDTVKDSTACESARKLAEICDRLNMPEQAQSLRAEAEAMERGEIGVQDQALVEA